MVDKKISLLEFENNPNIGLYIFANDKFAIIGKEVSKEKKKEIERVLDVPVYKLTILGTDLVGVFIAGNNDLLLIPQIYDYELKNIKEICEKHGVNLLSINEKLNTFGNNMSVSDNKIIINPNFNRNFKDKLKQKTKYKIIELEVKDYENSGSICRYLNGGFFLSQEVSEHEVKKFSKEVLGVGTVNAGSNMVSSGIVGNKNGLLLGSMSTTIEIQNITESLKYI